MKSSIPFVLLALAGLVTLAAAHYNIKSPAPYNPIDCNPPQCRGPCPPIWSRGKARARNSPSNPSAVWRRGQEVTIDWHRNNHEGGFYRRTLVPVKYMNSKAWHKKMAFDWGCWEQGRFMCGKSAPCGTDKKGFAYRNKMRVPNVYPDGDYVFGMVWYGGVHFRRKRGFFSDYYTCSYVRIKGGALAASHTPTYTPGRSHRRVPAGQCLTSKLNIGQCGGEECTGPTFNAVPGVFSNGKTPPKVLLKDLDSGAVVPPDQSDSVLDIAPVKDEKKAIEDNKREQRRDNNLVEEEKRQNGRTPLDPRKGTEPPTAAPAPPAKKPSGPKVWRGKPVVEWPVGSWGKRDSPFYERKRIQWYKRYNFCKKNKDYPNCYDGQ